MSKLFKFIKYILIVLLVVAFFVNIVSIISIYIFGNDYPNILGYTYFEVQTGSMRNVIREQDVVVVRIHDDYKVGDIITYQDQHSYITHRIVRIDDKKITTRGDANNKDDSPIEIGQVVGKVVMIVPELGIILKVITDKSTIILLFLFVLLFSYLSSLKEGK